LLHLFDKRNINIITKIEEKKGKNGCFMLKHTHKSISSSTPKCLNAFLSDTPSLGVGDDIRGGWSHYTDTSETSCWLWGTKYGKIDLFE
jgi:hypothetical protein